MTMTAAEAKAEIAILHADAVKIDVTDLVVKFTNSGLAQEVITRMQELANVTKKIGETSINVGIIILQKIWEFVERNPGMTIGIVVGAAIGSLTSMIPLIGPMIAPITTALGAAMGGIVGHQADREATGQGGGTIISAAKEFFRLFAEIFNALRDYFTS